jgi:hypothetical protein
VIPAQQGHRLNPSVLRGVEPTVTLVAKSRRGSPGRGLGRMGPPARGSSRVCDASAEFATSVNSRVINRHLEANGLNSGEFDRSPGMSQSLQKVSFVKNHVANRGRLWSFDELYQGRQPAKCKESLAPPPSGGSCHDSWVYPCVSGSPSSSAAESCIRKAVSLARPHSDLVGLADTKAEDEAVSRWADCALAYGD